MSKEQNDAAFDALEKEHGRCARLDFEGKLYAWRTPSLEEWEDYQDKVNKPDRPMGASFRELMQVTCVTDLAAMQELVRKRPAVARPVITAICSLAGIDAEVTVKKG